MIQGVWDVEAWSSGSGLAADGFRGLGLKVCTSKGLTVSTSVLWLNDMA